MKVYYCPIATIGNLASGGKNESKLPSGIELLTIEPERLAPQGGTNKCPAATSFISKFFLIRSPFDFTLNYDGDTVLAEGMNADQFNTLFRVRFVDSPDKDWVWVTTSAGNVFVTEESCLLELYPAFLHGNPFEISMGSFDIGKWQRPADFTFKLYAGQTVNVKRGDPLYYVAFKTQKPSDTVKLERIDFDEVAPNIKKCITVKNFNEGISWNIANGAGSKWNKPKKCPFSGMFNLFKRGVK